MAIPALLEANVGFMQTNTPARKTGETRTMSYAVRKKDKQRRIHNYGSYKDYEVAARVRDLLIEHDWEDESLPGIIEQVKKEFGLEEL